MSLLIAMSVCIIFVVNPTWMTTGATAVTRPPDNVFIRYSIFHGVLPILDLVWFGAQYIFINLETEVDPHRRPDHAVKWSLSSSPAAAFLIRTPSSFLERVNGSLGLFGQCQCNHLCLRQSCCQELWTPSSHSKSHLLEMTIRLEPAAILSRRCAKGDQYHDHGRDVRMIIVKIVMIDGDKIGVEINSKSC